MSRIVSFIVLLAFIVVIGSLFYKVMIGFLIPVFLAAVLVVVFRPLHRWVMEKVGDREHIAAAITTTTILFLVLLPLGIIATTAAVQGAALVKNFNANNIDLTLGKIRGWLSLEMPHQKQIKAIQREMDELQLLVATSAGNLDKLNKPMAGRIKELKSHLNELRREVEEVSANSKPPTELAETEFETCEASLDELNPDANQFEAPKNESPEATSEEPTIPTDEVNYKDFIKTQQLAVELSSNWQALKRKLLGGATIAVLRDLANPSADEMKAFREQVTEYIRPHIVELTSTTGIALIRLVVGCAILSLSLFFFLYDGPRMIRSIMQLSPLDDRYEQELLMEFDRTSRAVVLAMIFSAVVQGLIAGMGYYVVGMDSLILLILLTSTCALVPFVGPAIVWVPVCLYLLIYREDTTSAIGLAVWGTLVVGTSDNFVKAFVLHGQRQLHPLLALLSVLGGVQSLGPIGILVGPMAVTMLQTLLGILQHELTHFDSKIGHRTVEGSDRPKRKVGPKRVRKNGSSATPGDVPLSEEPPADGPPLSPEGS